MGPKKEPLPLDTGDTDTVFAYPDTLINAANDGTWVSPTKSVKRYHQPVKRRQNTKSGAKRVRTNGHGQGDDGPSLSMVEGGAWEEMLVSVPWDQDPEPSPSATATATDVIIGESQVTAYAEAVDTGAAGFCRVGKDLFVCQGWDTHRIQPTYLVIGEKFGVACTCPRGTQNLLCIHQEFFHSYELENLLSLKPSTLPQNPNAAIFFCQQVPNSPDYCTIFSVKGTSASELRGRAIVTHTGTLPSTGSWKCSKDSGTCVHIQAAYEILAKILGDAVTYDPQRIKQNRMSVSESQSGSVSHLPILPPLFISLKTDPVLYARPKPFRDPPSSVLGIGTQASCPCLGGRTFVNPQMPTVIHTCRIFTLYASHSAEIELQSCPKCPRARRRFIGPDLREQGLFNYNNKLLISHELLDEYTMAYVTSETPFVAWVTVVQHRYSLSGATFMDDGTFRSVWFAYAELVALENDMTCSLCGPYPETVIWDGVTLSFGKDHLTSAIKSPIEESSESIVRGKVKAHPKQQLLLDVSLRSALRLALKVPDLDEAKSSGSTKAVVEHLDRVAFIHKGIEKECEVLASLFLDAYGAVAFSQRLSPPKGYERFFLQIAAEESILQMINAVALAGLQDFIANPLPEYLTKILSIPGLYRIMEGRDSLQDFVPLFQWLANRAETVLRELSVDTSPIPTISGSSTASEWSQIRHRPKYPKIRGDGKKDKSAPRGDRCGKYYTQYGSDGLTGESEGRNDVFSAMITRWPVAPKRVIYDFACALGPYCMLREPEFFKNTFFAIDHFHAAGHSKCSPAAFLSEYANADPRLVAINSSAGECGNSGLKKDS
ncbi:hypothetical protein H1R20_g15781, partial [Candolleomyces eurysporus]